MNAGGWREAALCAQVDPELFFPDPGQTPHAAKRVCGACPVRTACLADALAGHEAYGVRGGMTPNERHALIKTSRTQPVPAEKQAA